MAFKRGENLLQNGVLHFILGSTSCQKSALES